jgi:hypothetical protein
MRMRISTGTLAKEVMAEGACKQWSVRWWGSISSSPSAWAVGVQIEIRERNKDLLETGDQRGSGKWQRQEYVVWMESWEVVAVEVSKAERHRFFHRLSSVGTQLASLVGTREMMSPRTPSGRALM